MKANLKDDDFRYLIVQLLQTAKQEVSYDEAADVFRFTRDNRNYEIAKGEKGDYELWFVKNKNNRELQFWSKEPENVADYILA
jgi:hypothetical protein